MDQNRKYRVITIDAADNRYAVIDLETGLIAMYLLHGNERAATNLPYYLANKVADAMDYPNPITSHIVAAGDQ